MPLGGRFIYEVQKIINYTKGAERCRLCAFGARTSSDPFVLQLATGSGTRKVLCMVNHSSRLMSFASVVTSRLPLLPTGPVGVSIKLSLLAVTPKDGT